MLTLAPPACQAGAANASKHPEMRARTTFPDVQGHLNNNARQQQQKYLRYLSDAAWHLSVWATGDRASVPGLSVPREMPQIGRGLRGAGEGHMGYISLSNPPLHNKSN